MALNYKNPGVYVEEISIFPPSIAQLETAIPGFIGYTAKRENNGIAFDVNVPQRITSLLEFEQYFGLAYPELLEVTIENPDKGSTMPKIAVNPTTTVSGYLLYYHVKMFYDNGGGPCFVVSVGDFAETPVIIKSDLKNGLDACEKEDAITLLAIPEITAISSASEILELNDAMLAQCAKLKDRFSILDVPQSSSATPIRDADTFRSDFVSADHLKYGAAYYPKIQTKATYNRTADDFIKIAADNRGIGTNNGIYKKVGDTKQSITKMIDTSNPVTALKASGTITFESNDLENHSISIAGISFKFGGSDGIPLGSGEVSAESLRAAIVANPDLSALVAATVDGTIATLTAVNAGNDGNNISMVYDPKGNIPAVTLSGPALTGGFDSIDFTLFHEIKAALNAYTVPLYPSGMVAGVMARVDNNRGVWKAPANESIITVDKPLVKISNEEQDYLNVDPTGGKSINAIRKFDSKGTLVWGARTLAGNDNEWRYVPIQRLFIMVEESIKKATEFVVFEPNDANTWIRVKAMCENFLNQLWRQGALAGAKPEHAYFVNVGLGVTMTSLDILEGRLIIEIGLAAVRPAEFIILKFSLLLVKS
ncbi:MAG: phage tail sheath family protein [Pedobacter sp.]|nr:MAG: phage tail sheath family protein [Pedobacter sp.]